MNAALLCQTTKHVVAYIFGRASVGRNFHHGAATFPRRAAAEPFPSTGV